VKPRVLWEGIPSRMKVRCRIVAVDDEELCPSLRMSYLGTNDLDEPTWYPVTAANVMNILETAVLELSAARRTDEQL